MRHVYVLGEATWSPRNYYRLGVEAQYSARCENLKFLTFRLRILLKAPTSIKSSYVLIRRLADLADDSNV